MDTAWLMYSCLNVFENVSVNFCVNVFVGVFVNACDNALVNIFVNECGNPTVNFINIIHAPFSYEFFAKAKT